MTLLTRLFIECPGLLDNHSLLNASSLCLVSDLIGNFGYHSGMYLASVGDRPAPAPFLDLAGDKPKFFPCPIGLLSFSRLFNRPKSMLKGLLSVISHLPGQALIQPARTVPHSR
ncbi:MAG: hypothetical protein A2351_06020 [Omnitrophica bacterium RIFOXYB12_FULL_50_7]|nr:MAG: hypothetical protein A2351_06020 [Omnitrophica bacterium RIFOXYB12_FULL_50_7]